MGSFKTFLLAYWELFGPPLAAAILHATLQTRERIHDHFVAAVAFWFLMFLISCLIGMLFWSASGFIGMEDEKGRAFIAAFGGASGLQGLEFLTDVVKRHLVVGNDKTPPTS